jgi:hypothetical protein
VYAPVEGVEGPREGERRTNHEPVEPATDAEPPTASPERGPSRRSAGNAHPTASPISAATSRGRRRAGSLLAARSEQVSDGRQGEALTERPGPPRTAKPAPIHPTPATGWLNPSPRQRPLRARAT